LIKKANISSNDLHKGELWIQIRIRISLVTQIRIRIKQDPDPHQSDKLNLDPHQFADNKPKCMEFEPI
jgi:hypothetical protein